MALLVSLVVVLLVAVAAYDLVQRRHTILRNYPVIGHLRFILEAFGPELRQYIVTSNDEEKPFSRDERRWVYASAKRQDNRFGFGTDNDIDRAGTVVVKHAAFPAPTPLPTPVAAPRTGRRTGVPEAPPRPPVPCAKVLGEAHGRPGAFRPASVVNVSAMSFGSLSTTAIEALNEGAARASCLHNTGEGGVSPYHLRGGDLVWQIGTGYFGCRDDRGRFDLDRVVARVAAAPVRAIEIKLSQGAKPGLGGMLPGAKVTAEIAHVRGVPRGQDCLSPRYHTAFGDVPTLVAFVERLAGATGLPVGIKSAVGELRFWEDLATHMAATGQGPDFVTIDGGEGGTGAAPLVFTDHVALPFRVGFSRVYRTFAARGVADDVVFVGSGRLGLPQNALLAMALGCDLVNVAREAMLALGCLQAQRCHTGHCPAGIATQSAWRARGLDVEQKSVRLANYVGELRHELLRLAHCAGAVHPALVTAEDLELATGDGTTRTARETYGYEPGWGLPGAADRARVSALMAPGAPPAAAAGAADPAAADPPVRAVG